MTADRRRKRNHRGTVLVLLMAVVSTFLLGTPASAAGRAGADGLWRPGGVQNTPSVSGHAATKPGATAAVRAAQARAAAPYRQPPVTWPAGTATATLTPATTAGPNRPLAIPAATPAGSLPVTVAAADAAPAAAKSVSVTVGSRAQAAAAGVAGVVLDVTRADGGTSAADVAVTVNYAGFGGAYGGGWADRLRLVTLPACAMTTPQQARCRTETPVAFHKDVAATTLTARVRTGTVLAATAGGAGSVGTYTATSLSPAATWASGDDSGDFTYSYPITLPHAATGTAPTVALAYDSGSVDARTSATNAQASDIGDGWDYTPGFVARSYQSCAQDGITGSGDDCWAGNELRLELGSHSSTVVRDDASGSGARRTTTAPR